MAPSRGKDQPRSSPASTQAPRTCFRQKGYETIEYSQGVGDRVGSAARIHTATGLPPRDRTCRPRRVCLAKRPYVARAGSASRKDLKTAESLPRERRALLNSKADAHNTISMSTLLINPDSPLPTWLEYSNDSSSTGAGHTASQSLKQPHNNCPYEPVIIQGKLVGIR